LGHAGTNPAVYHAVVDFARQIGMEPIEVHKEQRGYILNSILTPWLDAAEYLLLDGVAEPEMIDKTWRIATGMHQGPCEVMEIIGLTTVCDVNAASDNEKTRAAGAYLKEHYIDKGKLGRASGEGLQLRRRGIGCLSGPRIWVHALECRACNPLTRNGGRGRASCTAARSVDEHLEEHDEESQHRGERGREKRPAWAGTVTDRSVGTRPPPTPPPQGWSPRRAPLAQVLRRSRPTRG
jgi:3-hydroxyacyl-CoA dehydrogenase